MTKPGIAERVRVLYAWLNAYRKEIPKVERITTDSVALVKGADGVTRIKIVKERIL